MQIKLSLPTIPLGNDEGILCHTFCHEWKTNKLIIHGREYSLMLLHGAWFVSPSTWNVVWKLQSFTFMKFHVLGTFIFSSQFHEYIILDEFTKLRTGK